MLQAWSGSSRNALEKGLDEILDFLVLLHPHVNGDFLEDALFWGSEQSPLHSRVTEFRVFLSIEKDGKNALLENHGVLFEKGCDSRHGSRPKRSLLVLVQKNDQKFLGGFDMVDVAKTDDGLSLLIPG